ncbi:MAG TPA: N-acetyltransferase [Leeuwenhoekiella sp.]|nr:N-acetyltransferase [Leeuwenhoekiella sp.]
MPQLTFDTFQPDYAEAFERLNIAWLEAFFYVEDYDRKVLADPQQFIIDKGGFILVAKLEGLIVGVVALMPMENVGYELTKMAVDSHYRGQQIGQQLMRFTLAFAKENQITTLILYSNRKLENAIYIYRKFGFEEIPLEAGNPYDRADIKMKLNL